MVGDLKEELENKGFVIEGEIEEEVEFIESFLDVEGFEWLPHRIESIDEEVYINGIVKEIEEKISCIKDENEPFTEEDEIAKYFRYGDVGIKRENEMNVLLKEKLTGEKVEEDEEDDEYKNEMPGEEFEILDDDAYVWY